MGNTTIHKISYVLISVVLFALLLDIKIEWYGNAGYKDGKEVLTNTIVEDRLELMARDLLIQGKNIQTVYINLKELEKDASSSKKETRILIESLKVTQEDLKVISNKLSIQKNRS